MISVVIPTRNRPNMLTNCINSLLLNSYKDFEIIIVDQSKKRIYTKKNKMFHVNKIKYFNLDTTGKTKSLNFGIEKAEGDIIAFTDDDCITDKNWLKNIAKSFATDGTCKGVFGRVLPYQSKSARKNGLICPCTYNKSKKKIIIHPTYHAYAWGYGNNMAYKRDIFKFIGLFKTWLGPGSIGSNAEDAEFALRTLMKGYNITYNPDILVWHNKWITRPEWEQQQLSYLRGEIVVYGYYALKNYSFAKKVIWKNVKQVYYEIKKNIEHITKSRSINVRIMNDLHFICIKTIERIKGASIALVYFATKK